MIPCPERIPIGSLRVTRRRLSRYVGACVVLAHGFQSGTGHAQTGSAVDNPALGPLPAPQRPPVPLFQERPIDAAALAALRSGGFVLYLRHGGTQNDRADQIPVDLDDCETQRGLSDAGRATARLVGAAIQRARIPFGAVYASPFCRTRETARIAFGREPELDPMLMYSAQLTSEQKAPRIVALRTWLTRPVPKGTNRMLVAHGPNLMDLIGYFPKEGVLVVFEPIEGGFRYIGSVASANWAQLLR